MDDQIPVIVPMHVECTKCGHTESDTFEFAMPLAKARPMEAYEPGTCPVCGAAIRIYLKRSSGLQSFVRLTF